jgi:hypothetical protein
LLLPKITLRDPAPAPDPEGVFAKRQDNDD